MYGDDWDDDYINSIADAPKKVYCSECGSGYWIDEDQYCCPECDSEEFTQMKKYSCNHCGAEVHGDAYCDRCGNRINYDYDNLQVDSMHFADPGGNSALRAATPSNPRIFPCPDCGQPDRLTPSDKEKDYCCDTCADIKERGW